MYLSASGMLPGLQSLFILCFVTLPGLNLRSRPLLDKNHLSFSPLDVPQRLNSFGVIHSTPPFFIPSYLTLLLPPPTHLPTPPDNDVLIMRLLGQQIALQSHSHAVENCCCLEPPTPNPTRPLTLCESGRLTLASCWEWYCGTGADALSSFSVAVLQQRKQSQPDATSHTEVVPQCDVTQ